MQAVPAAPVAGTAATSAPGSAVVSALARCTAVDPGEFGSRHWSRAPLLTRAADLPGGFEDLLSDADVDELVAERGLREPFFRLVRDGAGLGGATRTVTAGARRVGDLADPTRVSDLHLQGTTLVLQSLHRLHPPVARFCRRLAEELGHAAQCNAYVTPGGDAQGFDFHHDTHDVFVLQVSGRKRWLVHDPVLELPLPSQPRAGDGLVSPGAAPLLDVVLEAGDCLYLPRGFVHAALTTTEHSVHLTVGVLSTTWYDVLQDAVALAADDPSFRAALPVQPAEAAAEQLPAFLQHAAAWLAALPPEQVRERLDARLAQAAPPEPVRLLAQAAAVRGVDLQTWVRPRRGLPVRLEEGGGAMAVVLPDRRITVPVVASRALRALLAGPCTPGRLTAAQPVDGPGLDAEGALVLVRRLLREGALVPA